MNESQKDIDHGWEVEAFTHNEHIIISENFLLFLTLLNFLCFLHYQTKFNQHYVFWEYIAKLPHSAWVVLISMFIGGMIRLAASNNASQSNDEQHSNNTYHPIFLNFNTNIFYFGFLPIIIFTSGFHVKRIYFYQNLDIILSLAVVGTLIATGITTFGLYILTNSTFQAQLGIAELSNYLATSTAGGEEKLNFSILECLAFASLISSTDPVSTLAIYQHLQVDYQLYYLVFGESILNDAVSITIFKTVSNYIEAGRMSNVDNVFMIINFIVIFLGSCCLGYVLGMLMAWWLKWLPMIQHRSPENSEKIDPLHAIIPLAVILCMLYIPYFCCEMLQLSGVVANFFAGMAVRRYVMKNLSKEVKQMASQIFEVFAYLAETCCFVILGFSLFLLDDINFSSKYLTFIAIVFVLISIARAIHVYGLLGLINLIRAHRNARQIKTRLQIQQIIESNRASTGSTPLHTTDNNHALEEPDLNQEMMTAHLHDLYDTSKPELDMESNNNPMLTSSHNADEVVNINNLNAANSENEIKQIPFNYMHMTFLAGLRGAVAYALAYSFPDVNHNRNNVLGTTAVLILLTLFLFGGLTQPLIIYFQIPRKVDSHESTKSTTTFPPQMSAKSTTYSQEDNPAVLISPPKVLHYETTASSEPSTKQNFERKYLYPWFVIAQPYTAIQLSSPTQRPSQSPRREGESQSPQQHNAELIRPKPAYLWTLPTSATTRRRSSSMGDFPEPSSGGGSVHHGGLHEDDPDDVPVLTCPRHSQASAHK